MSTHVTVTLPNGLTVSGTQDQVTSTLQALNYNFNPAEWYNSSTRGWIKIADMDSNHVRNAMLKLYRNHVESLSALRGKDLLDTIRKGAEDKTLLALVNRYALLVATGRV